MVEAGDREVSPERLLDLHLGALYVVRGDGKLSTVNEPGRPPAPRCHISQGPGGHRAWYRGDLPAEIAGEVARLLAAEPVISEVSSAPPAIAGAVRAVLGWQGPVTDEWRGPAFAFPTGGAAPALPAGGSVAIIDEENADRLDGEFAPLRTALPALLPCVVALENRLAVAVCHAARRSARAAEAGVLTLPGYRGRGYGAAVVARWAAEVRRAGLVPLYSCAWENTASRRLAGRLGLRFYAEDWHLT